MKKILVADTHTICREAIGDYIRQMDKDLSVSMVADYESLKSFMSYDHADLVLVDCRLWETHRFNKNPLDTKMIMLADDEYLPDPSDKDYFEGIFLKDISCKELMTGIHHILNGNKIFPSDGFFKRSTQHHKKSSNLSPREKEVLRFLVQGKSNKEIAQFINLQVVTIKLHVRGICKKLGVKNRTQAALMAQEYGL